MCYCDFCSIREEPQATLCKGKRLFPEDMISTSQNRGYSVVGVDDVAWSTLESLKVFTPASKAPTLDIVDLVATTPQQVLRKTFTSTTDLEDYIDQVSVVGGTRYM